MRVFLVFLTLVGSLSGVRGGTDSLKVGLSIGRAPIRIIAGNKSSGDRPGTVSPVDGAAYGSELFSNDLVRFSLNNPGRIVSRGTLTGSMIAGDFANKGIFYAIDEALGQLVSIDTTNGSVTPIGMMNLPAGHGWTGLSFDLTTSTLYAVSTNLLESTLYTVDPFSGTTQVVGSTSEAPVIIDIAVNSSGQMVAHDVFRDAVYAIDKSNGKATLIGPTGFNANFAQGMDFHPQSGELFLAAWHLLLPPSTGQAELRQVDLNTGNTVLVGVIGNGVNTEVAAFGLAGDVVDDLDPNPPRNVKAYSDYRTPGAIRLTWSDPRFLVNGNVLRPAEFTIEIERQGVALHAVSGGIQEFLDSGLTDGERYEYALYTRVKTNDSTSLKIKTAWVAGGAPQPSAPQELFITRPLDDKFDLTLHWINPSENVDGTPMDDFAGINLYEDGQLLATFFRTPADTAVTDSAAYRRDGQSHRYFVTTIDSESPPQESPESNIAFPPLDLPFLESFPVIAFNRDFWPGEERLGTPTIQEFPGAFPVPSGPYVLKLNGGRIQSRLVSGSFDLRKQNRLVLSLWASEHDLEPGEKIQLQYLTAEGTWKLLHEFKGTNPGFEVYQPFEALQFALPADAYHARFKFRFQAVDCEDTDEWFFDQIFLGSADNPPRLKVAPLILRDSLFIDATSQVSFRISNPALLPGDLNFTVAESPVANWLAVTPASGAIPFAEKQNIQVTLDAGGFTAGSYRSALIVSANDPLNPQDTVSVWMEVREPPLIGVSPDSFELRLAVDSTVTRILRISNSGKGPLNFVVSFEESAGLKEADSTVTGLLNPESGESLLRQSIIHDFERFADDAQPLPIEKRLRRTLKQNHSRTASRARAFAGLPELIYYKFEEVGRRSTRNFAEPATAVSDSAELFGEVSMGGSGQFGAALSGGGGVSSGSYVDSHWVTTMEGDWAISFWVDGLFSGELNYLFGDESAGEFRCFAGGVAGENNLMLRGPFEALKIFDVGRGPAVVEIVHDAAAAEIQAYVKGVLNNVVSLTEPLLIRGSGPFKIGGYGSAGAMARGTRLDEFKVFGRISREVTWMSAEPSAGRIAAGEDLAAEIIFQPTGLFAGEYQADIVLLNNDPVNPQLRVPVRIFVEKSRRIDVIPNPFIFPQPVVVNTVGSAKLKVVNAGNETLTVSDIVLNNPLFSVDTTHFTLLPFKARELKIRFVPSVPGVENDLLTIVSDDPERPELTLSMSAEAVKPPLVSVSPDTVAEAVRFGDSLEVVIRLSNSGSSSLYWSAQAFLTSGVGAGSPLSNLSAATGTPGMRGSPNKSTLERKNSLPPDQTAGKTISLLMLSPDRDISNLESALSVFDDLLSERFPVDRLPLLSVNDLLPFDVVLISNNVRWSDIDNVDPTIVGDVLADYIDLGGKVIVNEFAYDFGEKQLAGRFLEAQYGPFIPGSINFSGESLLGTIRRPDHPVMAGVHSLHNHFAWQNPGIVPGALLLAGWSDGSPLIAVSSNVVGVNILPSDGQGRGGWEGDLPVLYRNASIWLAGNPGGGVIKLPESDSGTVAAGGSFEFIVRLIGVHPDTTFTGKIVFFTNDPQHPSITVAVQLTVGALLGAGETDPLPKTIAVSPNYPNPFNPSTTINYELSKTVPIKLVIYNVLGQRVRTLIDRTMAPGRYRIVWGGLDDNGRPVSSGIYIYQFEADTYQRVHKMLLLK